MADELSKLRGTAGNLQVETELIYRKGLKKVFSDKVVQHLLTIMWSKFDDTTVKISASLSKLQNKIATHVSFSS